MSKQQNNFKIAFISAKWHEDFVSQATTSCKKELATLGVDTGKNIKHIIVPGSLETPLVAKLLAESGEWDAIIAFGLIVDGGIYRHEFVAQTVLNGMTQVSLETKVPVLSAVLTPQTFDQKDTVHMDFLRNHLVTKGIEAAHATVAAIEVIRSLKNNHDK